jgi:chromosome transmission fidelity protein 4
VKVADQQPKEREPWFPRPLLQSVELRVPLLGMDGQSGKLEESYVVQFVQWE